MLKNRRYTIINISSILIFLFIHKQNSAKPICLLLCWLFQNTHIKQMFHHSCFNFPEHEASRESPLFFQVSVQKISLQKALKKHFVRCGICNRRDFQFYPALIYRWVYLKGYFCRKFFCLVDFRKLRHCKSEYLSYVWKYKFVSLLFIHCFPSLLRTFLLI